MTDKKKTGGLAGVTAGKTALCTVGKEGAGLTYCGYDIYDLADNASFEEVAHLLLRGHLPTQTELDNYVATIKSLRGLPDALKTVLEMKVHAGTTIGSEAPTFERFYVGGTGRWAMRGFEYRGISPRSGPSDEPVGSEWAVVGNAEVAVPLGTETFSWLFFHDIGFIDDGGPRASIGTGIQILIPQFFGPVPMRFELAAPYMEDDDDDTQAFSFSMGALF